ncbi:hypothetical protein CYMTET_56681 [Cymbomonas tetramitiformis]|uniref:Hydroxyproline O-arabinosyltransferase-like domain-containing protein n=1 Tax=Cymbomonas tetramitiformis TaxID=36881 RepID=A0AAE0BAG4_9CHLO|nr:hypothetical protein CYMTET_56681 [Cymbomonas tetramitiformis]
MARRRSSSSSFSNLVLLALTLALFTGGLSWYRSSSNNLPASLSRVEEAHERIDALEEKVDALMRAGKGQGSNAASEQPKISEETSTDFGRVKRPKGVVTQPGIHAIVTSNGNRYMNWQTRVSYNSYMRQSRAPGSQFKAFTRLLHRATDDELMQEVPTVRIPSDHPDCDVWCSYPVADRGPALLRFLNMKIAWQYEHILVLETDHIFVAPLTIPLPQKVRLGHLPAALSHCDPKLSLDGPLHLVALQVRVSPVGTCRSYLTGGLCMSTLALLRGSNCLHFQAQDSALWCCHVPA